MQKKIKVLHLLNTGQFSGAENVVCQIIKMFQDNKYEMAYCSLNGQIRYALEERKITYFPIRKLCRSEIKRIVREFQPDIIHAHDIRASIVASGFSKKAVLISHIHGNHEDMRSLSLKSFLYKMVSNKFKRIIWVSNSSLNQYKYKDFVHSKSMVLNNIININELFKRVSEDIKAYNYDVAFVGRLSYPKNPIRLIEVLKQVVYKIPNARIAIVGNGDLADEVKEKACEIGIIDNIDFSGFVDNPYKVLRDSKVFVMTSIYEGTPMSALEAMALGVPIVSTPTDGLAELVIPGKTGYLSDENEVLADHICHLLTDEQKRAEMAKLSKERAIRINNINNYKNQLAGVYYD